MTHENIKGFGGGKTAKKDLFISGSMVNLLWVSFNFFWTRAQSNLGH